MNLLFPKMIFELKEFVVFVGNFAEGYMDYNFVEVDMAIEVYILFGEKLGK